MQRLGVPQHQVAARLEMTGHSTDQLTLRIAIEVNNHVAAENDVQFFLHWPGSIKQIKAVKWWKKAVEEAERLDARPDLARTYMEISRRFLEEKSKYKELNGISAKEYLEKAREMFQEMNLQWDLDELEKIASDS